MATERIREFREWATLTISAATLIAVPIGGLILKNFKYEIREESAQKYVSIELYRADRQAAEAEKTALKAEIITLNAKVDKLQITLVRLTDAVKLQNP